MFSHYGLVSLEYADTGEPPIDSILMGDGSVGVSVVGNKDEVFSGVEFFGMPKGINVGGFSDASKGENPYFSLLFDNPDSIDVLIGQLQKAKELLMDISESEGKV